ncbi:MAG TPA: HAD family hydrolase [Candidatus Copromorpha excrementigallinarum]|uniref:HAD family hydrolase n=1 Tax=Candidatus Allocopromorpha excrementigallinarum TaxID=2840742 RepID=A0A9D1I1N7_9FIRM|nr:HAD family hydrolase [Candidatus Copromorpha excrementigallinarum]
MKYKAAIFDMDGTILNTLEDLTEALNYALKTNGLPERSESDARRFLGNGLRRLIELSVPEEAGPAERERVFEAFNLYYSRHMGDHTEPYEGILSVIKELRKKGIHTAVVSNKRDYAVRELCERYFRGLFEMAAGEKDGVRRKPYPDSVEEVMKSFGVKGEETVYIGDSEVDAETAENAGADCILVDWGFRDRDFLESIEKAAVVSTPRELLEKIIHV